MKIFNRKVLNILFSGFLVLFLELALIRWIPAQIRLISYFGNLILIASFLGIGLGFLNAKRKLNLFLLFPALLLILISLISLTKLEVNVATDETIFLNSATEGFFKVEPQIIIPAVFVIVALIFCSLGQFMGKNFTHLKPLTAYSADISGSLLGIFLFSLISFLGVQPFWWFFIVGIVYFLLSLIAYLEAKTLIKLIFSIPLIVCLLIVSFSENPAVRWSPYYKVEVNQYQDPYSQNLGYALNVNNTAHQFITTFKSRPPFYYAPYEIFKNTDYKKILIIGAGGGTDVSVALNLSPKVERIDAVEIDPVILNFGKNLNPDKPFHDSRVNVYIDDGRHFLQNSNQKYDLIIYALPDSLTLTGISSGIRLESFLFTREAFEQAKNHLSENGLFSAYNYYREDWLIDKIAGMLNKVFSYPPYVITYGTEGKAAVFLTGNKVLEPNSFKQNFPPFSQYEQIEPTSDDWPFLYLKDKGIPFFYIKFVIILVLISLLLVALSYSGNRAKFDLTFFSLGVAFLLLETKSLINFGLLFGNTWLVNSLVFAGILISILIANLICSYFNFKKLWIFFILLTFMLCLNYIIPQGIFLKFDQTPRFLLASVFYFSPIFFANVIFSQKFKNVSDSTLSFGSNLLGAVFGGFLEYSSLMVGFKNLIIVIIIFYIIAFLKNFLKNGFK